MVKLAKQNLVYILCILFVIIYIVPNIATLHGSVLMATKKYDYFAIWKTILSLPGN